ncbi:methylated-DNA--[protein]-cysteine S-methyltransferase [Pedobacter frigiditerrae]|uniref:methylated-DNA--[protein]-cysteine S-methyltransferase n=1 Tax=Pedobacter frigiditerrae TaxID=2530452 RepID=A0A4R0MXW0_9SPHI|nr:methylated-DNA--[protein]-cysteine S-methyltransferase [Pedobacter frigiditerrae]TCC92105.1 methylated-DNA--[protein]-cysteine S-methyltransferase [Pedobacter frigiditerrae]
MEKYCSVVKSPIGDIIILADDHAVNVITFGSRDIEGLQENSISQLAAKELTQYFEGNLQEFSFPMAQEGTEFQKEVWQNLLKIPYGETTSYAKFSAHKPLAIRAIAAANGKNNIAIVVPCHRVIGSDGKLVGYAGELWRKKWLLQHEIEVAQKGQTELKF